MITVCEWFELLYHVGMYDFQLLGFWTLKRRKEFYLSLGALFCIRICLLLFVPVHYIHCLMGMDCFSPIPNPRNGEPLLFICLKPFSVFIATSPYLGAVSSVLFGWLHRDGTVRACRVYGDMHTEFLLENLKGRKNISWFWTETYWPFKTKQEFLDWKRSRNVQLQYIRGVEPLCSSIRWLFIFLVSMTDWFLEAQNFRDCWRNAASCICA